MKIEVITAIAGEGNGWKVATSSDRQSTVKRRKVFLEIQGDTKNGYHLIMSPEGCFTADTWHESIADAVETATRLFDVPADSWK